jgi:uncharacterized membrane protein required for colicin V production
MIGLDTLFWAFIVLFAVIGALRGWGKEVLVTFSAILGLFIIHALEKYMPFVRDTLLPEHGNKLFYLRIGVMAALAFFGYQTPNLPRLAGNLKFQRNQFQDSLLGFFLGGINAYLLWGTIWFYLADMNYQIGSVMAPLEGSKAFEAAQEILPLLPPNFISSPVIYFAVAIAFAFLLVVFL